MSKTKGYDKDLMSKLYGADYNGKHKFGDVPGGFANAHWDNMPRWRNAAADIIALVRPKTLLELGCGRGSLVLQLRTLGVDAVGIDISEWAIRNPIVPEVAPYISHLALQDLSPTVTYDVLVGLDVIEHIPFDYYDDTFQILRQLAPQILVTVPVVNEVRRFTSEHILEHYIADDLQGWTGLFESLGYEVVDFTATSHFPFDKKNTHNYPFLLRVI